MLIHPSLPPSPPPERWAGDYGGPMFLTPGLIFACYTTKRSLAKERDKTNT
jgi:hypothetical protein